MEKRIIQKKDPFGLGNKFYVYKNWLVQEFPYFIYEIHIYKYWKGGFSQLDHKFFKSSNIINIKKDNIFKKTKDLIIEKSISLIGVTHQFINDNNLKEYKPIVKKKKHETVHRSN